MKKVLFFTLALAATNINAQLLVDSLGRVGIATDSVKSMFAVGAVGDEDIAMFCNANNKEYGSFINNSTNASCSIWGGSFITHNATEASIGVKGEATGGSNSSTYQYATGLAGHAGRSYTSIGVLGGKTFGSYTPAKFAGVYGTETFETYPSFTNYPGIYAGYFNGKVRVTNGIYATVLSPSASPSPSGQNGMTVLSDRNESVTDKLSQVQAVQFLRYDPAKVSEQRQTPLPDLTDEELDKMSFKQLDSLAKAIGGVDPEPYLSPVQYGLDADQLKTVYPELVYEDANGNVSINYVEMIPLLVQSINELKNEIAELKGTSPKKAKAQPTAVEESVSDIDMVRMDQNKPNPFSESTVIALNIPSNAQAANIYIYDMSGKQVQSLPVSERGETNIIVYASDLAAGMYIYTLVVDGKVNVTRRMIVSK